MELTTRSLRSLDPHRLTQTLQNVHEAQLLNYLKATGYKVGEIKRLIL